MVLGSQSGYLRECGAVVENCVLLLDEPPLLASATRAAAKAALGWFARLLGRSFDLSGDSATSRVRLELPVLFDLLEMLALDVLRKTVWTLAREFRRSS